VATRKESVIYYWASLDIHASNVEASEEGILNTLRSMSFAGPKN
jgi:hypothetical protein